MSVIEEARLESSPSPSPEREEEGYGYPDEDLLSMDDSDDDFSGKGVTIKGASQYMHWQPKILSKWHY